MVYSATRTPPMLLFKRQREEQETEEQTPQQGDDLIAECAEQALASDFRLHWANAVSSSGALSIPSGIPVLSQSNTFLYPPPPCTLCPNACVDLQTCETGPTLSSLILIPPPSELICTPPRVSDVPNDPSPVCICGAMRQGRL